MHFNYKDNVKKKIESNFEKTKIEAFGITDNVVSGKIGSFSVEK